MNIDEGVVGRRLKKVPVEVLVPAGGTDGTSSAFRPPGVETCSAHGMPQCAMQHGPGEYRQAEIEFGPIHRLVVGEAEVAEIGVQGNLPLNDRHAAPELQPKSKTLIEQACQRDKAALRTQDPAVISPENSSG